MKSLYESILGSTNSGKNSLPVEWSEVYSTKQWKYAAKDYISYYKVEDKSSKELVEGLFQQFATTQEMQYCLVGTKMQSKLVPREQMRFVRDIYFEDKVSKQLHVVDKQLRNVYGIWTDLNLYLIFWSDGKIYYYNVRTSRINEFPNKDKIQEYLFKTL